jgi:hypothetical protein
VKDFPVNKRGIAVMTLFLMVMVLIACESTTPTGAVSPFAFPVLTPSPLFGVNQEVEYAAAQATLNSGNSDIMELSHQATVVSLNLQQAANAEVQAQLDDNQRRLMELSIQGTEISHNLAQAAATQQFITEQNQMAWDAAISAQSQAVTATFTAYLFIVTQTAQAQAILDVQATQVAQAKATRMAYSLTATPFAALQADIIRARNEAGRRALWGEFVVTPVKLILTTLVVLLLLLGGVVAYQRLMPLLELRLRTISRYDDSPLLLLDGVLVDPNPQDHRLTPDGSLQANLPQISSDQAVQVEVVGPTEPSIVNWIAEAEHKLRSGGRATQR